MLFSWIPSVGPCDYACLPDAHHTQVAGSGTQGYLDSAVARTGQLGQMMYGLAFHPNGGLLIPDKWVSWEQGC
jgi:hypothetical protein